MEVKANKQHNRKVIKGLRFLLAEDKIKLSSELVTVEIPVKWMRQTLEQIIQQLEAEILSGK